MSKPVYMLILVQGYTEAWYQLSKEEQTNLWSKVNEANKRAGARWIILCDARWADQGLLDWGVMEYPDIESHQKKMEELEKLDWWRYVSVKTILGTKMEE